MVNVVDLYFLKPNFGIPLEQICEPSQREVVVSFDLMDFSILGQSF